MRDKPGYGDTLNYTDFCGIFLSTFSSFSSTGEVCTSFEDYRESRQVRYQELEMTSMDWKLNTNLRCCVELNPRASQRVYLHHPTTIRSLYG